MIAIATLIVATLVTEFDDHAGAIAHHLIVGPDSVGECWRYHEELRMDGGCVAIIRDRIANELTPIAPEPFRWMGTRPLARPQNNAFQPHQNEE